jgi:ankyrin repeat protein
MADHLCETLHDASRDGHGECIKRLFRGGADINHQNKKENEHRTLSEAEYVHFSRRDYGRPFMWHL